MSPSPHAIHRATLETCHEASGTVVVIDVLRAVTTACYAFLAGAAEIVLVSTRRGGLRAAGALPGCAHEGRGRRHPD